VKKSSRRTPRYSKGQKVRVWVGDEFVLATVTDCRRVGKTGFQYDVLFYESGRGAGAMWEHQLEPEDAVSRLGEIRT